MGILRNTLNALVSFGSKAYDFGKKAVKAVANTVVKAANQVVKWASETFFKPSQKAPGGNEPGNFKKEKQKWEKQKSQMEETNRELAMRVEEMNYQMQKEREEIQEKNQQMQNLLLEMRMEQERAKAQEKEKEHVRELIELIDTLADAALTLNEERVVEDMGFFSRLIVSIKFLEDMSKDLKSVDAVSNLYDNKQKTVFIRLIQKFLNGNISESELEQFNDMTKEFYNKDLLQFGAEEIILQWNEALKESDLEFKTISKRLRDTELDKGIAQNRMEVEGHKLSPEEKNALGEKLNQLTKEIEDLKTRESGAQLKLIEVGQMVEVANGYIYLQQVGEDNIEDKDLLELAHLSAVVLSNWQRDLITPSNEDMETIYTFGSLFAAYKNLQIDENQNKIDIKL